MNRAPLEGIKVVELARILAGPWAGQTLADLGAEVVKIESLEGDDTRRWGPPFVERQKDRSAAYFHSCNRGKRSIAVDLRSKSGRDRVLSYVAEADVLLENFKVGGLVKFGLDFGSLSKKYPELIYCSITGFGQTGPYAARPGYDFIIQGMSGLMSVTGDPSGHPQKVGVAVTDILTGLYGVVAILAALREREHSGKGQQIDLALLDVAVSCTANQALNYLATGNAPQRMGNNHPNLAPYQVFPCEDGHIIIAIGNDSQFDRFSNLLSLPHLARDRRFKTNADRVVNREQLNDELSRATTGRAKSDLLHECERLGIPAGPINDISEVFADPQVVHRGLRLDLQGIPGVRCPIVYSRSKMVSDVPSPRLCQENET